MAHQVEEENTAGYENSSAHLRRTKQFLEAFLGPWLPPVQGNWMPRPHTPSSGSSQQSQWAKTLITGPTFHCPLILDKLAVTLGTTDREEQSMAPEVTRVSHVTSVPAPTTSSWWNLFPGPTPRGHRSIRTILAPLHVTEHPIKLGRALNSHGSPQRKAIDAQRRGLTLVDSVVYHPETRTKQLDFEDSLSSFYPKPVSFTSQVS